jgi:hypothetical protein
MISPRYSGGPLPFFSDRAYFTNHFPEDLKFLLSRATFFKAPAESSWVDGHLVMGRWNSEIEFQ